MSQAQPVQSATYVDTLQQAFDALLPLPLEVALRALDHFGEEVAQQRWIEQSPQRDVLERVFELFQGVVSAQKSCATEPMPHHPRATLLRGVIRADWMKGQCSIDERYQLLGISPTQASVKASEVRQTLRDLLEEARSHCTPAIRPLQVDLFNYAYKQVEEALHPHLDSLVYLYRRMMACLRIALVAHRTASEPIQGALTALVEAILNMRPTEADRNQHTFVERRHLAIEELRYKSLAGGVDSDEDPMLVAQHIARDERRDHIRRAVYRMQGSEVAAYAGQQKIDSNFMCGLSLQKDEVSRQFIQRFWNDELALDHPVHLWANATAGMVRLINMTAVHEGRPPINWEAWMSKVRAEFHELEVEESSQLLDRVRVAYGLLSPLQKERFIQQVIQTYQQDLQEHTETPRLDPCRALEEQLEELLRCAENENAGCLDRLLKQCEQAELPLLAEYPNFIRWITNAPTGACDQARGSLQALIRAHNGWLLECILRDELDDTQGLTAEVWRVFSGVSCGVETDASGVTVEKGGPLDRWMAQVHDRQMHRTDVRATRARAAVQAWFLTALSNPQRSPMQMSTEELVRFVVWSWHPEVLLGLTQQRGDGEFLLQVVRKTLEAVPQQDLVENSPAGMPVQAHLAEYARQIGFRFLKYASADLLGQESFMESVRTVCVTWAREIALSRCGQESELQSLDLPWDLEDLWVSVMQVQQGDLNRVPSGQRTWRVCCAALNQIRGESFSSDSMKQMQSRCQEWLKVLRSVPDVVWRDPSACRAIVRAVLECWLLINMPGESTAILNQQRLPYESPVLTMFRGAKEFLRPFMEIRPSDETLLEFLETMKQTSYAPGWGQLLQVHCCHHMSQESWNSIDHVIRVLTAQPGLWALQVIKERPQYSEWVQNRDIQLALRNWDHMPPSAWKDRDFILRVASIDGGVALRAGSGFADDRGVVAAALRQNGLAFEYASKAAKGSVELAKLAVQQNPHAWKFMQHADLSPGDREEVLHTALTGDARLVEGLRQKEQFNERVIREVLTQSFPLPGESPGLHSGDVLTDSAAVIKVHPNVWGLVPDEWILRVLKERHGEIDIAWATVPKILLVCFRYANGNIQRAREAFVQAEASQQGVGAAREQLAQAIQDGEHLLDMVDPGLWNVPEFVRPAIRRFPDAVKRVPATSDLWGDREFSLQAIRLDGLLLGRTHSRQDPDMCRRAVAQNGRALAYVQVDQAAYPDIPLKAVEQTPEALPYVRRGGEWDPALFEAICMAMRRDPARFADVPAPYRDHLALLQIVAEREPRLLKWMSPEAWGNIEQAFQGEGEEADSWLEVARELLWAAPDAFSLFPEKLRRDAQWKGYARLAKESRVLEDLRLSEPAGSYERRRDLNAFKMRVLPRLTPLYVQNLDETGSSATGQGSAIQQIREYLKEHPEILPALPPRVRSGPQ
ncbi:MAG: hypothetical protein ACOYKZ_05045 [Chlamydiia bacterium]